MLMLYTQSLTGGVLLLRNKFFIILYRGKDFLPGQVANVIVDREIALRKCQTNEEGARMKAIETSYMPGGPTNTSRSGTLYEFQEFQIKFQKTAKGDSEIQLEAYKEKLERELRNQEYRLRIVRFNSLSYQDHCNAGLENNPRGFCSLKVR